MESAADAKAASAAVVTAMAEGDVTPDEAARVMSVLLSHKQIIETADLEARITALEGRAKVRNLSSRLQRLEIERRGPDQARLEEEARQYIEKLKAKAAQFKESDRDISAEDWDQKMSIITRTLWKVRFVGADFENELCEYERRKDTDPDARLLHWRFDRYTGLDD